MAPVQINGTTYEVMRARTATEMRSLGYGNTAHEMDRAGIVQELALRRPAGKRLYCAMDFGNGRYSQPLAAA